LWKLKLLQQSVGACAKELLGFGLDLLSSRNRFHWLIHNSMTLKILPAWPCAPDGHRHALRLKLNFQGLSTMNPSLDSLLIAADGALRTLFAQPRARRASPADQAPPVDMTAQDRALAGALMRVNHVGEVCAQALYAAQALSTRDAQLRQQFEQAGQEEADHLAWTHQRLDQLGARPSLLNPLWYAGAFGLGLVAGRLGDAVSLGFL
jgi:hypothetical protein